MGGLHTVVRLNRTSINGFIMANLNIHLCVYFGLQLVCLLSVSQTLGKYYSQSQSSCTVIKRADRKDQRHRICM